MDRRASIQVVDAWKQLDCGGSADVTIAVVDDSCWVAHPSFSSEKWAGVGLLDAQGLRMVGCRQAREMALAPAARTHGTSLCTLIAADRGETLGVAPGCRLLPIVVPASGDHVHLRDEDIHRILDVIDAHTDVAVLPWSRLPTLLFSRQLVERFTAVGREGGRLGRGVVFVVPAGNSNCPIHHSSSHAAVYHVPHDAELPPLRSHTFRNVLTTVPEVLHVAATTARARRAAYSCYGPGVDLCAPSSASLPFRRELSGPGITTTFGPPAQLTHRLKGTSAAAGIVAGVAALFRSAAPRATAHEVCRGLEATASRDLDRVLELPRDRPPWMQPPIAPFERGEFDETGWSAWFGYGRVDAAAAVRYALSLACARST